MAKIGEFFSKFIANCCRNPIIVYFFNRVASPAYYPMDKNTTPRSGRAKVDVSIQIDPDLLDRIQHLTDNPSRVIEAAIRQWLQGDRDREDDLTRLLPRNPAVPPRGEWND